MCKRLSIHDLSCKKNWSILKNFLSSITAIRFRGIMILVVSRADRFQLGSTVL